MSTAIRRILPRALLAAAVFGLVGFAIWVASLPAGSTANPKPVPARERMQTLEALAPPAPERPLVAVIGLNDATETTDYIMPAGILRRADVADVRLLATREGPVKLYPALTVVPDATTAAFDADHPDGANYVIVPAMSRDDDPAVLSWLRQQADKGAIVIAICAGAKVAAAAGLLDGRRATTHWYFLPELLREHPSVVHVADRRYVVDRGVATTTGVSASMPMALTLVAAIAGQPRAEQVADDVGLAHWDASHDSSAFRLTRPFAMGVLGNVLAFWQHEDLELVLTGEFDAVSLALTADAWSRTYRSQMITRAASEGALSDRDGIRIVPDRVTSDGDEDHVIAAPGLTEPAVALDRALAAIAARYGQDTAALVAMQLEYPWRRTDRPGVSLPNLSKNPILKVANTRRTQ